MTGVLVTNEPAPSLVLCSGCAAPVSPVQCSNNASIRAWKIMEGHGRPTRHHRAVGYLIAVSRRLLNGRGAQ